MIATHTITNHFTDFRLLDLSHLMHRTECRGPFLLEQDGSAPGDPRMRQCSFVMTKRGTWLHFYLYLAMPESVRSECVHFETAAEAIQRANTLCGEAVVETAESLQELLLGAGFEPEDETGRKLLEQIKARHNSAPEPIPSNQPQ